MSHRIFSYFIRKSGYFSFAKPEVQQALTPESISTRREAVKDIFKQMKSCPKSLEKKLLDKYPDLVENCFILGGGAGFAYGFTGSGPDPITGAALGSVLGGVGALFYPVTIPTAICFGSLTLIGRKIEQLKEEKKTKREGLYNTPFSQPK